MLIKADYQICPSTPDVGPTVDGLCDVCVCVCVYLGGGRACVRACVRACMRACIL